MALTPLRCGPQLSARASLGSTFCGRAARCSLVPAPRAKRCHIRTQRGLPVAVRADRDTYSASYNPVQTPHSGYHDDGWPRRFFEGWYFRVALPADCDNESFALIYSIDDPHRPGRVRGVGAQVMGAKDGYFLRQSPDTSRFWAWRNALALGNVFRGTGADVRGPLSAAEFDERVSEGFQATATWHQGNLVANDGSAGPGPASGVDSVKWAFSTQPVYGWGDVGAPQRASAGWLSALPVFEPHWQVLMAHGLSTGFIQWGDRRYDFKDAPTYAEKNWGGEFPKRWFWAQCNAFENEPQLSLTVGGGLRALPLTDATEEVALIGVHYKGTFIEIVPWSGELSWEVEPWGRWEFKGSTEQYAAEVVATCAPDSGTPLRAPMAQGGLTAVCKDTFFGELTLTVWEKTATGRQLLVSARSTQAGLEVGGGPWFNAWSGRAAAKEPFRSLLRLPVDVSAASTLAPPFLRPPGL